MAIRDPRFGEKFAVLLVLEERVFVSGVQDYVQAVQQSATRVKYK